MLDNFSPFLQRLPTPSASGTGGTRLYVKLDASSAAAASLRATTSIRPVSTRPCNTDRTRPARRSADASSEHASPSEAASLGLRSAVPSSDACSRSRSALCGRSSLSARRIKASTSSPDFSTPSGQALESRRSQRRRQTTISSLSVSGGMSPTAPTSSLTCLNCGHRRPTLMPCQCALPPGPVSNRAIAMYGSMSVWLTTAGMTIRIRSSVRNVNMYATKSGLSLANSKRS